RNINQQTRQDHEGREIEEAYVESDNTDSDSHPTRNSATTMSEEEISMLQDFRIKMENIRYNLCNVCQERIPLLTLVKGTCDVPDELKGLSEIEEMLISQVFTVMTVYRLRGGQNGYRGHVINFPQDIQGFTKQLPRDPRSLDVLV
ncbi:7656_t:CDS:2, partial [Rhizophagus irregularis]